MINQQLVNWMVRDIESMLDALDHKATLEEVRALADAVAAVYHAKVPTVLPDPAKPDGFLITSESAQ